MTTLSTAVDTTAKIPDPRYTVYLPLHWDGKEYSCRIMAKDLEEKLLRREIQRMLDSFR